MCNGDARRGWQRARRVAAAAGERTRARKRTTIYARVDGYLKRWLVDIGDTVHPGQLLAEIETPETDQDSARKRARAGTSGSDGVPHAAQPGTSRRPISSAINTLRAGRSTCGAR